MTDPLHPKDDEPQMPEPVAYKTFAQTLTGDPPVRVPLITTASAQAYAEALAAHRVARAVAAERERWTDAVMYELDSNGQAEAIVRCVTGQPPATGK